MNLNIGESAEKLSVRQAKIILLLFVLLVAVLILGLEIFEQRQEFNREQLKSQLDFKTKDRPQDFKTVSYDSYQQWQEVFTNYQVDEAGRLLEIPHLKIKEFPKDMGQINKIAKRKKIFFNIVAISAYHANQKIIEQRNQVQQISNQYYVFGHLGEQSQAWLEDKFDKYDVKAKGSWKEKIKRLKKRLDVIPLSLILAQAAIESGWGTSRFATQANNIFGEWTFDPDTPGIIPKHRPADADYRIRKFASIEAAINSYLLNLNSHFAYDKLRQIRFDLRQADKKLDPLQLSAGLTMYSEKREAYIEQINNIIRYNDLQQFDRLMRK